MGVNSHSFVEVIIETLVFTNCMQLLLVQKRSYHSKVL